MKENNNCLYCFVMIALLSIIFFNLFISFESEKTLTAEELFNQTTHSVVEIRASTDEIGESFGSAVFVCEDGSLVTNAHVVTYKQKNEYQVFENLEIRFAFEDNYRAVNLIKYDLDLDIAILKLNETCCEFKPIEFADSSVCKTGNTVYTIGNLNNVGISMTKGIISNPSINVEYNGKTRNVIQCDLAIAEGNSGGVLLNENGKLLGITTFRLKDLSNNVVYGICYCVPANAVVKYINK